MFNIGGLNDKAAVLDGKFGRDYFEGPLLNYYTQFEQLEQMAGSKLVSIILQVHVKYYITSTRGGVRTVCTGSDT
jgi:hypothetical protein